MLVLSARASGWKGNLQPGFLRVEDGARVDAEGQELRGRQAEVRGRPDGVAREERHGAFCFVLFCCVCLPIVRGQLQFNQSPTEKEGVLLFLPL